MTASLSVPGRRPARRGDPTTRTHSPYTPRPASLADAAGGEEADRLDVLGHREHVEGPQRGAGQPADGTSRTSRANAAGSQATYATARGAATINSGPPAARAGPRRVQHDHVRPAAQVAPARPWRPHDRHLGRSARLDGRGHDGAVVDSTRVTEPVGPTARRARRRTARPAVEVPRPLPRPRREHLEHGRDEGFRGRRDAPARTRPDRAGTRGRPPARARVAGPDTGRAVPSAPSAVTGHVTGAGRDDLDRVLVRPAPVGAPARPGPRAPRSGTSSTGTTSCERC